MDLFDADHCEPDEVLAHPRHLAMQPVVTSVIQQLRGCQTVAAGYAFQQDLLARLLEVEKDRGEFKRAADRVRRRKAVHAGAPEPQSGRDPRDPDCRDASRRR